MRNRWILSLAVVLSIPASAQAALSENLVKGGDFEDTSYLKTETAPDGTYAHRYSEQYDLDQKWLCYWGPPSVEQGLGGFSTFDDIRTLGGTTRAEVDIGNMNRSVDPLNPGNHILENSMFRPQFGQWFNAPANQVAGPMQFSFDFYYNDWMPYEEGNNHIVEVSLYGTNFLPPDQTTVIHVDNAAGDFMYPLGEEDNAPLDGDLLVKFRWGAWWNHNSTSGWQTVSTETPDVLWDDINWGSYTITTDLTQDNQYQYYALIVWSVTYTEDNPYFWLYGGKIVDTFSQGFDNFNFQVSVAPSFIPGDFNGDGVVTLSDINPFKLALTDTAAWQAQYPDVILTEVDPNGDGVITLSDINPFKTILTGGNDAAVPEPATGALLLAGLVFLAGRNRLIK
ncbi:MAG: PEP-CTERM sorting domain-containing protein [Phycisphaeraceae bacterium]|nr:PEP-CTERM sorting domain-containing protein [Phycisphaeraceae bacterium]